MKTAVRQIPTDYEAMVRDLASLVAIPSVSTDGQHQREIDRSAKKVSLLMQKAGLENVKVLKVGKSNPFAYGDWMHAPGAPTLFLYAHHDVQPPGPSATWESPPWKLTRRKQRLFAFHKTPARPVSAPRCSCPPEWRACGIETWGFLLPGIEALVAPPSQG